MMTNRELSEKYGHIEVGFSCYYKYQFMYTGLTDDGKDILVTYGDTDIYRTNLDLVEQVSQLLYGDNTTIRIEGEIV